MSNRAERIKNVTGVLGAIGGPVVQGIGSLVGGIAQSRMAKREEEEARREQLRKERIQQEQFDQTQGMQNIDFLAKQRQNVSDRNRRRVFTSAIQQAFGGGR